MQPAARTLLECQLSSIRPKHDAHAWQHWHPDHGAGLQVLPPRMSQELLQACMGSSRMSCQLTFLMTLSKYASRHCWARYVQQHSHVMSAPFSGHSANICFQVWKQWCNTHRYLSLLSYLQKQCTLESDHEYLRFVHKIPAAIVDLFVVPEIYAWWRSTIKTRQSHRRLYQLQLFDKKSLHWLLFQDDFGFSEEMAFASPVLADRISGKAGHVQLLDGAESSGDQQGSDMHCMYRMCAGRLTQALWAQFRGVSSIAVLCIEGSDDYIAG